MRIVCTVTNDLAQDQRMDRICTSLQAAGHAVTLVGRRLPTSAPLTDRPYRQFRIDCRNLRGKAFYAEYNYRLWRRLRGWDYDAVCAVDLDTLLAGYLLTRNGRARLVYDAHEWFSETPEVYRRPLIRGAWRVLGRALVPRTDARYTVAAGLAGELEKDYGVPFEVVRNLPRRVVETDHGTEIISNDENSGGVILYQGMLNPGRGLEVAIWALSLLPDLVLWIVGSGPERQKLEQLAAEIGVARRVIFHGFVPYRDLPNFTQRAWLGLNLFEVASPNYYWSLANKALDYVQSELPSVQMDLPEYRRIADRYGCYLLLEELAAEPLAAAIRELMDRPNHYAGLRRGCAAAAADLCWEREEEKLLAIWAGLATPVAGRR